MNLGLSEEEFANLSPEQYGYFLSEWKAKQKRELEGFAALWATYVNAHRADGKSPVSPDDFFGEEKTLEQREAEIATKILLFKKYNRQ